jgi:hypothetical protein
VAYQGKLLRFEASGAVDLTFAVKPGGFSNETGGFVFPSSELVLGLKATSGGTLLALAADPPNTTLLRVLP